MKCCHHKNKVDDVKDRLNTVKPDGEVVLTMDSAMSNAGGKRRKHDFLLGVCSKWF